MAESIDLEVSDDLADCYDLLVDWPNRLSNERGFFLRLFEQYAVQRIVDVACGTGHHAAMFYSWGLDVEGADISAAMLNQCRELHGESTRLRWVRRSFLDLQSHPAVADAVVCLGNSLSLCANPNEAQAAIRAMAHMTRPSGIGIVQVLNPASIPEGPTTWQKVRRARLQESAKILIKGLHRDGEHGLIEILEIDLTSEPLNWRARSMKFLCLNRVEIESMIRAAGGEVVAIQGSYAGEPFDASKSGDLIITWRQTHCG